MTKESWLDEAALEIALEIMPITKTLFLGGDAQKLARIQVIIREGLGKVSNGAPEPPREAG